jgi:hypothetical protein
MTIKDIRGVIGKRVCIDLDTGCRGRTSWRQQLPGTVISASQISENTQFQGWRGRTPVVEMLVRLDDGREYPCTDCDVFGWIVPVNDAIH